MLILTRQISKIHAETPAAARSVAIEPSAADHGTVTATYHDRELGTGRIIRRLDVTRDGTAYELEIEARGAVV